MTQTIDPKRAPWADEYPFESHWLELGPHKLHYLDEGASHDHALVMVHGNPTWSFYYRRLVREFRDQYRCVVPDHIGCGLSDKPQDYPYTLAQRIEDLERLVERLGLRSITMVVHDWGGAIGMGFAARHPELIKRLVIFNTAAFRSKRIPFSIDICRIPGFGALAVRGLNGFAQVAQVRAIHDSARLKGAVRRGYLDPYGSWADRVAIHRFVQDIPMRPEHPSYQTLVEVEQGLAQFEQTPALVVWGDEDFCFDVSFREEWQRRMPHAEVHALKDASHYVLEDAHERIIPWMHDFFKRHPVQSAQETS